MNNPNVYDLVIINEESKTIHLGSKISGSCNLKEMESADHRLNIVKSKGELNSFVQSLNRQGFRLCLHCCDPSIEQDLAALL